ncbi:gp436 family protein [Psychrobacter pygoscelis]|uniref:gp436 family protein n=1 Tax=Psychrobacter pygoscelis TaxID=2488563 RepID=UPI00103CA446|nr:phage protein Gp36 family protein [Psychrobacter pygoscelis]
MADMLEVNTQAPFDAYATRNDLINRYSMTEVLELESMHGNGSETISAALSDATTVMNGYLAKRYRLPLNPAADLKIYCCDIARYHLYKNQATDEVRNRYKDAIKWLESVVADKVDVSYNTPLTDDEHQATRVAPAVPIGDSYKGSVFGDDVFAAMPTVGDAWTYR